MNDFNYDNEIIEVSENTSTLEDLIREEAETGSVKPPKKKKSLKDKIKDLSKKQKITLIVIGILVLLMIIGIVLFFVLNKDEEEIKPQEVVIVEKDNYRYENGKLIFLDSNEEEIGSYECADKDLEKCYVAKINLENDTFDRVKSVYENGEELEKNSKIYYDNYVFVYDEEKITLYSIDTKENCVGNVISTLRN